MTWPKKPTAGLDASEKHSFGKGVFRKCDGCGETRAVERFTENSEVCPLCQKHHKLGARGFRELLLDGGKLEAWDHALAPGDPLTFSDGRAYPERVASTQKSTHAREAIETGLGHLRGRPIAYGAFVFAFMGGSMGSVVGEKVARTIETGLAERRAVIVVSATGGARMQEGILSLMQMAKTSALLAQLQKERLPFVSVLTDPSTAGVLASYASLGDVIVAEPKALVGFAGARVIRPTSATQCEAIGKRQTGLLLTKLLGKCHLVRRQCYRRYPLIE